MYENYGWKYVVTVLLTVLFGWALKTSPISLGIDLRGGSELLYKLDLSGTGGNKNSSDTDTTVQVLQNRLDALAIKELSIRRQGQFNIVIQVPGGDPEAVKQIKKTVETTGVLDFKLVVTKDQQEMVTDSNVQAMIEEVKRKKAEGIWKPYVDDQHEYDKYDIGYPKDPNGPILLLDNRGVAGKFLRDAHRSQDSAGRPAVGFVWNSTGKNKFYDMTSNNIKRAMAIVLDGIVQSAPVIQSAIGEQGIIEGGPQGFQEDEVKRLIVVLKAGALPGKPIFEYGQEVGSTLGQAATTIGSIATIVSMLLVLGFMVFYYKQGGIIANVALVLNIMLLLGTLAMFGATLTVPGIAGILLTAGMAVDANILIFERMREEKARGADPKQVVEVAYDRAFWTIFDSHLTTLITGLVLYWTGTGPIRGFAVTLIIGISISLFTSLFVTKAIYGWLGANEKLPPVNFRHLIENPHFDFMGFFKPAVTGSFILINVGFAAFLLRGSDKYGIDFTGGTVLDVRLKDPMPRAELDKRIAAQIKEFETQRVGAALEGGVDVGTEFEIRTRILAEQLSAKKVSAVPSLLRPAYGDDAPVATQSTTAPAGSGTTTEESAQEKAGQDLFRNKIVEIFKNDLVSPFTRLPGSASDEEPYVVEPGNRLHFYVNLLPRDSGTSFEQLTPDLVKTTVKNELSAVASNPAAPKNNVEAMRKSLAQELSSNDMAVAPVTTLSRKNSYSTFEVTTGPFTGGPDQVTRAFHDVLRSAFSKNPTFTVAEPLPRVESIGGAVAKNLKAKAFLSMFAAIVAIVLYVAFRFEFIWGIGAVLSLVHDLFTTMGFMALADTVCTVFHIPFDAKINLPTVAAFLTLLGYSIMDTVVVYDRIREKARLNKEKHVSNATINEAINGTLSRTILTSLTVFLVAVVLFGCSFFDLPSIQGFSLAMCFGVVTGTYSSIFIAAPVLTSDPKKVWNVCVIQAGVIVGLFVLSKVIGA
jgi:SecD/SecF fusion protein